MCEVLIDRSARTCSRKYCLLVYGTVRLQLVYSFGTCFFDTSFSVLVQRSRTTTTLLSGDVLDEPARSAADLGTGGYDVEPPEVQGTPRSQTRR